MWSHRGYIGQTRNISVKPEIYQSNQDYIGQTRNISVKPDMEMIGAIFNLIILIPFLIFAIILTQGKRSIWHSMKRCPIMYVICFSILLWALSEMLENQILFFIGIIFMSYCTPIPETNLKRKIKTRIDKGLRNLKSLILFLVYLLIQLLPK
jgi:hypothetical protein